MKEMNRREFLTLTGAAVVALSLAGCGEPPHLPQHPPKRSWTFLRPSTRCSRTIGRIWEILIRSER